jgi:hypothetical protein
MIQDYLCTGNNWLGHIDAVLLQEEIHELAQEREEPESMGGTQVAPAAGNG